MKKFHLKLILITTTLCIISCKKEIDTEIEKRQIYVSSVTNVNTQTPFHEVWVHQNDTLWKYDFWKNQKAFSTQEPDSLKPNDHFIFSNKDSLSVVANFTLYKDLKLFNSENRVNALVKTSVGSNISGEQYLKIVNKRLYETSVSHLKTPNSAFDIIEKISFSENTISYYWEYYYRDSLIYSETETVEYSYFEVEDQLFIIPSTQENAYPIYQVVKANKDEIQLTYFTDFEPKIKSYKVSNDNNDTSDYTSYSLCKDSFQSIYYHGEDVRYSYGMEHLLQFLQEGAPKSSNEGFVNIHFTVNCTGEVGRFGLELLDRNYQPTNFEPKLIQHIVDKVKQLTDFDNVDKIDYRGAKDAKLFFLIHITNQQISEVCP